MLRVVARDLTSSNAKEQRRSLGRSSVHGATHNSVSLVDHPGTLRSIHTTQRSAPLTFAGLHACMWAGPIVVRDGSSYHCPPLEVVVGAAILGVAKLMVLVRPLARRQQLDVRVAFYSDASGAVL
ncbi:hypothetical protein CBL_12944 [Carabus blaptoides fortunei]